MGIWKQNVKRILMNEYLKDVLAIRLHADHNNIFEATVCRADKYFVHEYCATSLISVRDSGKENFLSKM